MEPSSGFSHPNPASNELLELIRRERERISINEDDVEHSEIRKVRHLRKSERDRVRRARDQTKQGEVLCATNLDIRDLVEP